MMHAGKKLKKHHNDSKAKFRVMHHKFHDEAEWHIDPDRDELDSELS